MPRKKKTSSSNPAAAAAKAMSKTAFVASVPDDVPAKDVVAKAKAAGMTISPAVVHAIRSTLRKKAAGGTKKPGRRRGRRPSAVTQVRAQTNGSHVEDLLRAVAAEIGLGSALAILQAERATIQRVLRA